MREFAVVLVAVAFLVTACTKKPQESTDRLTYFRDAKTDLCFAAMNWNSNQAVLTCVPCTDEVKANLVK